MHMMHTLMYFCWGLVLVDFTHIPKDYVIGNMIAPAPLKEPEVYGQINDINQIVTNDIITTTKKHNKTMCTFYVTNGAYIHGQSLVFYP